MFDNIQFLNDLYNFCCVRNIKFSDLSYSEQLACIRSMLVGISRNSKKINKKNDLLRNFID